ncbi:MAG: response regulator transcription factor [Anaerolineales bacterium]|jgi:DNA-binding response OmpR family regulator|nr:response regulator transcription factor [Anaerolineales bacterium]MCW5887409.1 response regulator transcription factor [Anaerolineales bacterium]
MPHKVLVVEDDAAIREALSYNLGREGYQVDTVADGAAALAAVRQSAPDVVILDLMLPGLDGFEVTRALRKDNNVPILMLTARDDEIDRVLGLEMGADDYLTKPFSMRELLARVKAMLRRVEMEHTADRPAVAETVASGNLAIDLARHEVTLDGAVLDLKPKEYELLLFLMQNRGRAYTREQLLEQVWGWEFSGGSRTVDVHVRWLRARIEADAEQPQRIITVRGVGYRFEG